MAELLADREQIPATPCALTLFHGVLLFCICGTAPETDKIRKIVHVSPLPDSIHLQNVRFTALVTPLVAFERPTARRKRRQFSLQVANSNDEEEKVDDPEHIVTYVKSPGFLLFIEVDYEPIQLVVARRSTCG